jgi:DNA-binding transcriptional ArsR family regulator
VTELSDVAALLADRTRARILEELLGGVALPAGALAARVGVAPSTVSGHLAKLAEAGLIVVEARGRRREASLARPEVAEALEALGRLAGESHPIGLRAVNDKLALREARSCYDHLAGRAGIALAEGLVARGALALRDGAFSVADPAYFASAFGIDVAALPRRRPLVRACLDWTEREPHVAGALGAALLDTFLARAWVRRRPGGRALNLSPEGAAFLRGIDGADARGRNVA